MANFVNTTTYTPPTVNDIANKNNADAGVKLAAYGGADKGMGLVSPSYTPIYTPPQSGGSTASTPVVTASSAQDDYAKKLASFNAINQQINAQAASKLTQAQSDAQAKAMKDVQIADAAVKQQELSQKQQEIDNKNKALNGSNVPTNGTPPTIAPTTPSTTTNGTTGTSSTPPPTPAPQGTTGTSGSTTGTSTTSATDSGTALATRTSDLSSVQSQKDTLADSTINLLKQVLAGTIPLSAPQQALITSLQTQLSQNEASQTVANTSLVGATAEAAFRSGGEYTPEQMAGRIQNAVSIGVQKIQSLDNEASKTIASLENEFQKQNYDNINKQYDILTKQLDDKSNAIKDTYDTTLAAIKDARDQAQKTTDKISAIALDASKNGADQQTQQAIRSSKDEAGAIAAAGNFLQNASGTLGDYLQYKRDAMSNGLVPKDYQTYKDEQAYKDASIKAQAAANVIGGDKVQQKLEQQYRQVLSKEFSSRTGALGVENGKVNQANHLNSLFTQYFDPKTGNYNIPKTQYAELAIGLGNLISPTGTVTEGARNSIMQSTAKGDINAAIAYATGVPQNGSTQDVFKNLIDSVDRQAETAVSNRETALQNLRDQAPTDLEQSRIDRLNKSTQMIKYAGEDRISKSHVDDYVRSNPKEAENIAKMYQIPGATNKDIEDYLKAIGKI